MMRTMMVALLGMVLAACGPSSGGDGTDDAGYTPVPDDELFSEVAATQGVVDLGNLDFYENWPDAGYGGEVRLAPNADAQEVLDRIYAILRQGRPRVTISVSAIQDGRVVRFSRLDGAGTLPNLEERYGPQPGDGTPPGD